MTFAHIPIEKIHVHPSNVRFIAVADDAMIASIRSMGILDPIMVAPHADLPGEYLAVDGHRRLDGARKAGLVEAPANIRADLVTEAQQVEVMIATAVHREDLTPVEEAAAYEQLELFGMTPKQMSESTGRPLSTIKARLKLRALPESSRTKLHEGQLTLGDAEALLEFTDQPEVLTRLEAAVGGGNLRYEISRAREERDLHTKREAVAREVCAGIAFEKLDVDGAMRWNEETGPTPIDRTGLPEAASHIECGRVYWPTSLWQTPFLVCTDPGRHPKAARTAASTQADKERADRDADWARQRAEREEERLRQVAAAKVRIAHLMKHFTGIVTTKAMPKPYIEALRLTMTAALYGGEGFDTGAYVIALGLDETDDWTSWWNSSQEYIPSVRTMTPAKLLKAHAALLTAQLEWLLADPADGSSAAWAWLAATGYDLSDVDTALRDEAKGDDE